jgi:SecD/SecF fusion protein
MFSYVMFVLALAALAAPVLFRRSLTPNRCRSLRWASVVLLTALAVSALDTGTTRLAAQPADAPPAAADAEPDSAPPNDTTDATADAPTDALPAEPTGEAASPPAAATGEQPPQTGAPAGEASEQETVGASDAATPADSAAATPAADASAPQDIRSQTWLKLLVALAVVVVSFGLSTLLTRAWRLPEYWARMTTVLFSLIAGTAILIMGFPPRFGIDLSGGVILVYEIKPEETPEAARQAEGAAQPAAGQQAPGGMTGAAMDKLIAAVSRRINPGGYKEITIRPYGQQQIEIIVPEADEAEVARLRRVISSVGTLEFRILANNRDHADLIELAQTVEGQKVFDAQGQHRGTWVPVAKGKEDSFPYDEIARRTRQRAGEPYNEILVVEDQWDVTGQYLARAARDEQEGRPCVSFTFNSRGGYLFGILTSENLPDRVQNFTRQLGIILDGYLHSAPAIQRQIRQHGQITGDFTPEEVEELVSVLNAGSLPTALSQEPMSQLFTGPTLGQDTIEKGTFSIVLSVVLVAIFMLIYYRFSGIVANLALVANMVLILAIMIVIKAPLTLPGLAGLVLTVGMAVDANVLIYERMREELERGAALRMAIRNGFDRAWSAIFDSNITTLITATILYWVGSDQVKGFAVTLWLGIALSMYTAVYCARLLFDIAERRKWITRLKMMRIIGHTQFDFLRLVWPATIASLVLITIGLVAVVSRGRGILDIDFTGGVAVETLFNEPQDAADVRSALAKLPDLAVMDIQLAEEARGRRFLINTSSPPDVDAQEYLQQVEKTIAEAFGDKLAHYSLKVTMLDSAAAGAEPAQPSGPPAGGQSGQALPSDSLLAAADPSMVLLAQADAASTAESSLPANSSEPAAAEAEQAASREPPPEQTTSAKPGAAGQVTTATLTFAREHGYDSVAAMVQNEIDRGGPDLHALSYDLTASGYEPGDESKRSEWTINIQGSPATAKTLLGTLEKSVNSTVYFPASNTIGGAVAENTQVAAVAAMIFSILAVIVYLWIRFQRVMYGLAAVVALVHDVLVTLGLLALSSYLVMIPGVQRFFTDVLLIDEFKIGLSVVAAFLTIIGYSLNDTIVIFDRIREIRGKSPRLTADMINLACNQTLSRTLLTSLTVLIVVVILYIGGGPTIHAFAFAMVVGVFAGCYSTVFIASPVLLWMSRPSQPK